MARMSWLASLCQGWRCNSQPCFGQDLPQKSEPAISGQLLHLVRPIARHYAQQTGLESDDLQLVGCLGLIKAYNHYYAQRDAPFPSSAKPHIRGAILHFIRDRVGLIRLPRAVEERAMQMVRSSEGSALSPADALLVDH